MVISVKRHLAPLVGALILSWAGPTLSPAQTEDPAPTESGADRANRLLKAMGGRRAWAAVDTVIIEATHFAMDPPTRYDNRIVNDLTRPRVRFEAHAPDWDRWANIDGETGLYRRDNEPTVSRSAERIAEDNEWWQANFYRTLRRLAKNDRTLELHAVGDDRLEIHTADGPLNWFRLNTDGAPVMFGSGSNEEGTIMGPLLRHISGIYYPIWGAGEHGAFRYQIENFYVNPALRAEAFEIPPASGG